MIRQIPWNLFTEVHALGVAMGLQVIVWELPSGGTMDQLTNNDGFHIQVGKKRTRRQHWIAPEIVRKEASRSAIQHQYFSPQWFAEFKDYLHNSSPPFNARLLEELCLIVVGTEACRYCIRREGRSCCTFGGIE